MNRPFMLLEQLFAGLELFEDADGDGIVDNVRLKVVVPRSLSNVVVWSELLHLSARLAFETAALTFPIVGFKTPSGSFPCLVFQLTKQKKDSKRRQRGPDTLKVHRVSSSRIVVRSDNPYLLGTFIRLLALGDQRLDLEIDQEWSRLELSKSDALRLRSYDACGHRLGQRVVSIPGRLGFLCRKRPPSDQSRNDSIDLLNLSGKRGLYDVPADNARARRLNLVLQLPPESISPRVGLALCEAVSRLVLEATDLELPFVSLQPCGTSENLIEIHEDATCTIPCVRLQGKLGRHVVLSGSAIGLSALLRRWLPWVVKEEGPGADAIERIRRYIRCVQDILLGEGENGRWAHLLARRFDASSHYGATPQMSGTGKISFPPVNPHLEARVRSACSILGLDPPQKAVRPKPMIRRSCWTSEQERLLSLVNSIPRGSGLVTGTVFVSKPLGIRRRLKWRLETILRRKGYSSRLRVFNAYKPGLSWLLEEIIPTLRDVPALCRGIELSFRQFPRQEGTMELCSRWLQEIYPGPDLLARSLGLEAQAVRLKTDPGQEHVYRVRAWEANGRIMLDDYLSPRWRRIPYYGQDPPVMWTHPTTGGIFLEKEREILLDQDIRTDREQFWKRFGENWLPALKKAMKERWKKKGQRAFTAFWKELRIEVDIEESEYWLDLDEERIAPMEALHEDIYFVLLDFYKNFASALKIPDSVQLGQVVPVVSARGGARKPHAKLYAKPFSWSPLPEIEEQRLGSFSVDAIHLHGRRWAVELSAQDVPPSNSDALMPLIRILRVWGYQIEVKENPSRIVVWVGAPRPKIRKSISRESKMNPECNGASTSNLDMPPAIDRILSAEEVIQWINLLGRHPYLQSWQAGVSSNGRPVWALELSLGDPAKCWSLSKMRLLKPSVLFNARHHANEVASTEAALRVAWLAATDPCWREKLKTVNLVWIPMENIDGVVTFERLYPTAPGHKLHAARYNAAGTEFYSDYFRNKPRFADAWAKRRVWKRWLPVVVLDGHGVPSHEWDQPFSGYAPGMFAEHWIPRTFLYVYLPFFGDPSNPRRQFAKMLAKSIATEVRKDEDLVERNEILRERYQRYARRWEPEIFPPAGTDPLLVLAPVERVAAYNFAVQKPEITVLEVVTEVVDEVAQGKWLELCVRGHMRALEGIINALRSHPIQAIVSASGSSRGVCLTWRNKATICEL